MTITDVEVKIRPMILQDLEPIFLIDHKIRGIGKAITYANITTEHIFNIDGHVTHLTKPLSYIDLITGDVSELLDLGFVADVGGHVCGCIVGRVGQVGETVSKIDVILILGVHPDHWGRGIATRLVNLKSQIKEVRYG